MARRAAARRWPSNFGLTALNVVVLGALPVSGLAVAVIAQQQGWGLLQRYPLPLAATLGVALLARSLVSYAVHVAMHKVPVLWRVHRVHHTDVFLDVSTTVRFHPLEFLIQLGPTALVILGLGLPPWTIMLYELVDTATNLFIHANARVPARLDAWLRLAPGHPRHAPGSPLGPLARDGLELRGGRAVVGPAVRHLPHGRRAIPGRPGSGSRSARTGGPRLSAGSSRSRSGRAWSAWRSVPDMDRAPEPRSGRASSTGPGLEHSLGGADADSGWLAALLVPYVAVLRIGVIAREERYLVGSSAHSTVPTGSASGDGSERPGQD